MIGAKPLLALGMVAVLAGCQANPQATARQVPLVDAAVGFAQPQDWGFNALAVVVPESLSVSEENSIKPRADIVWREDPMGDRHAQVDDMVTVALEDTLLGLRGATPVNVEVQITRFHALTERTRYSIGGEHEIEFIFTVRDASSNAVLRGPRAVDLTFPAAGGDAALEEEARGYFQRDAIRDRLTDWANAEFRLAPLISSDVVE